MESNPLVETPFYKKPIVITGGIVAICLVAGVTVWLLSARNHAAVSAISKTPASHQVAQQASTSAPSGMGDTQLNSDLTGINKGVTQEGSDMTTADTSVNDQQSQIAVPTN